MLSLKVCVYIIIIQEKMVLEVVILEIRAFFWGGERDEERERGSLAREKKANGLRGTSPLSLAFRQLFIYIEK